MFWQLLVVVVLVLLSTSLVTLPLGTALALEVWLSLALHFCNYSFSFVSDKVAECNDYRYLSI